MSGGPTENIQLLTRPPEAVCAVPRAGSPVRSGSRLDYSFNKYSSRIPCASQIVFCTLGALRDKTAKNALFYIVAWGGGRCTANKVNTQCIRWMLCADKSSNSTKCCGAGRMHGPRAALGRVAGNEVFVEVERTDLK